MPHTVPESPGRRFSPADGFPLAAALGIACGVTVLVPVLFNYFVQPIGADLGLGRPAVAAALSVYLGVLVVALPVAGAIADRIGAQRMIIASAIAFGLALYWISRIQSGGTSFYLAFGVAGVAGAGASPISYARILVQQFTRHRGLALGIALSGGGLAGIVLPMIVRPIVLEDGWRAGFEAMALFAVIAGVGAGLLSPRAQAAATRKLAAEGVMLREALSTIAFWTMAFAFMLVGAVLTGVTSHLTEIWIGLGLDPATVPQYQAVAGIATIAGRLIGGAAMDVFPAKFVGAAAAIVGAGGIILLGSGFANETAVLFVAVAMGICTGTESDVVSYLTSRFFGLRHFARLYGIQASSFMIGSASGPLIVAVAAESVPYSVVLVAGSGGLLASAVALLTLRPPFADLPRNEPAQ